jgi:hypothetical protein
MKHQSPHVKTFPLSDTDLHGAAVLQISLMDAQGLIDELEGLRNAYAKQLGTLSLILKAFADLFSELTDETSHRKWLSTQMLRAERETVRLRIPAWFWRLDSDSDVSMQLKQRAAWMRGELPNATQDDLWDLLVDVLRYAGKEPDETLIAAAIRGEARDHAST